MAAATYYSQVQEIYVAYYGRPADPAGLQYWAGKLDASGGDLTAIINAFGNSTESTALYAGSSNSAIVTAIFQQMFKRAPDDAGLKFYTDALTAKTMTAASIALNIADGAKGTDATTLANKITVATAFTDALTVDASAALAYDGTTAITAARSLVYGVTTTADTSTVASTITAIKSGGGSTAGQTFTLTTSADTFVGTTGNDTFNATSKTLSADDRISDSSTTDSDTLKIVATADPAVMNVSNVENITIDWQGFSTPDLDLDEVRGAKAVTITSTKAGYQGDANVTNAGSNGLIFGTGIDGDVMVSGSEDSSITANFAETLAVSGGDGVLTISANAADSIDVSGGDELNISATAASTIELSGGADVVNLTIGSDVDLQMGLDDEADVVVSSDEDVTLTLVSGGNGFATMTAQGAGEIGLAVEANGDVSGAEIVGFASLTFDSDVSGDVNLGSVDVDTEIILASGSSGGDIALQSEATVTMQSGDDAFFVTADDTAADTLYVTLEESGANISFTSSGGSGDFESSVITVDASADHSGDFTMDLSGAADNTIISTDGDLAVFVSGSGASDASGDLVERVYDASQVAGDFTYEENENSGDLTVIGGAGLMSVFVDDHSGSGSTVSIITGAGGSYVSGGDVDSGDTLAVIGAEGDDHVVVENVSGDDSVASLVLGNGDNTVEIETEVGSGGAVVVQTGSGDDTVILSDNFAVSGGARLAIDLGDGDNDTLDLTSGGADFDSSGDISIENVEIIDFGNSGSSVTMLGASLDGQSYTLTGFGADGNASGGEASGASGASGGQVEVLLGSGGADVDFSDLTIDGLTGLFIDASGSGSYNISGTTGDDDVYALGSGGVYTINLGQGSDEIWLSGDGTITSATLVFANGDSDVTVANSGDLMDKVFVGAGSGSSGDIGSGDIVFDFNLAKATETNFLAESGDATGPGDAVSDAIDAFSGDASLVYFIVDDGTDSYLFVDLKGDERPEIGIKLVGLSDATVFTVDNIST